MAKALAIAKDGAAKFVKPNMDTNGYETATAGEIVRLKGWLGRLIGPFAIYSDGVPKPWRAATGKPPDGLTTEDNITQKGKFLSGVVREALSDDNRFSLMLLIAIGVGIVGLIAAGIAGYEAYQTHQMLQQILHGAGK